MAIDPATGQVIPGMNPFANAPRVAPVAPVNPTPAPIAHPAWLQNMQGGGQGLLQMMQQLQANNPDMYARLMHGRMGHQMAGNPGMAGLPVAPLAPPQLANSGIMPGMEPASSMGWQGKMLNGRGPGY